MYIGKKIKELRMKKEMTLSTLAKKSGIQIASLSRMEHLKMTGTLESHVKIANVLGVELSDLHIDITSKEDDVSTLPSQTVTDIFTYNENVSQDILTTHVFSKKMMPILLKIKAEGKTTKERNNFGSEKFVYVLSGQAEVIINKKSYPLNKNNTLYFDSSREHYFVNPGKAPTQLICVSTPVAL